ADQGARSRDENVPPGNGFVFGLVLRHQTDLCPPVRSAGGEYLTSEERKQQTEASQVDLPHTAKIVQPVGLCKELRRKRDQVPMSSTLPILKLASVAAPRTPTATN